MSVLISVVFVILIALGFVSPFILHLGLGTMGKSTKTDKHLIDPVFNWVLPCDGFRHTRSIVGYVC